MRAEQHRSHRKAQGEGGPFDGRCSVDHDCFLLGMTVSRETKTPSVSLHWQQRDERRWILPRYHSVSSWGRALGYGRWRYPCSVTGVPGGTYCRFGPAAQQAVRPVPSTASQQPAALWSRDSGVLVCVITFRRLLTMDETIPWIQYTVNGVTKEKLYQSFSHIIVISVPFHLTT